jgi:tRNA threonylcarbamoyladenosine biosynthesis protein TsaE
VPEHFEIATETEMRQLGASLKDRLVPGDIVLLYGELGAGKTTLVRGFLESLGHTDPVRSPTFNLLQVFDTTPPVLHADLYRVTTHVGLGIEDYLETHITFIEWPDRAVGLSEIPIRIEIEFSPGGRTVLSSGLQKR